MHAFRIEPAAAFPWNDRVQCNDSDVVLIDDVFKAVDFLAQVFVIGKGRAQGFAVVVIPRDQVIRHFQRRQQLAQEDIFFRPARIDQVTGHRNRVRPPLQTHDVGNASTQTLPGVDHAVGLPSMRLDVKVRDLGENHERRVSCKWADGIANGARRNAA